MKIVLFLLSICATLTLATTITKTVANNGGELDNLDEGASRCFTFHPTTPPSVDTSSRWTWNLAATGFGEGYEVTAGWFPATEPDSTTSCANFIPSTVTVVCQDTCATTTVTGPVNVGQQPGFRVKCNSANGFPLDNRCDFTQASRVVFSWETVPPAPTPAAGCTTGSCCNCDCPLNGVGRIGSYAITSCTQCTQATCDATFTGNACASSLIAQCQMTGPAPTPTPMPTRAPDSQWVGTYSTVGGCDPTSCCCITGASNTVIQTAATSIQFTVGLSGGALCQSSNGIGFDVTLPSATASTSNDFLIGGQQRSRAEKNGAQVTITNLDNMACTSTLRCTSGPCLASPAVPTAAPPTTTATTSSSDASHVISSHLTSYGMLALLMITAYT